MNLYNQYQTDKKLEREGIVLNYGELEDGTKVDIRIARAGGANTTYNKVAEQILKPYRRQLKTESMDNELLESLFIQIYAKTVVLGWTGVCDAEGNRLDCTEANVIKVLTDLPELYKDIREAAENMTLFRAMRLEEESKN